MTIKNNLPPGINPAQLLNLLTPDVVEVMRVKAGDQLAFAEKRLTRAGLIFERWQREVTERRAVYDLLGGNKNAPPLQPPALPDTGPGEVTIMYDAVDFQDLIIQPAKPAVAPAPAEQTGEEDVQPSLNFTRPISSNPTAYRNWNGKMYHPKDPRRYGVSHYRVTFGDETSDWQWIGFPSGILKSENFTLSFPGMHSREISQRCSFCQREMFNIGYARTSAIPSAKAIAPSHAYCLDRDCLMHMGIKIEFGQRVLKKPDVRKQTAGRLELLSLLKHSKPLNNAEVAKALGITEGAARLRLKYFYDDGLIYLDRASQKILLSPDWFEFDIVPYSDVIWE